MNCKKYSFTTEGLKVTGSSKGTWIANINAFNYMYGYCAGKLIHTWTPGKINTIKF